MTMFLTKEEKRKLWKARAVHLLQATVLEAGVLLFVLAVFAMVIKAQ